MGLARAAGYAPPDSGNPDLLRLSGYRHRSISDRWFGPPDDAGHTRTECGKVTPKQPQLDQREADLYPRVRRHDEPSERLHARRAADTRAQQHADPEHDYRSHRDAHGDLLRRTHQYRRLRQDSPEGIQLPARRCQQSDLVPGQWRHSAGRLAPPYADRARSRRSFETAVQRRCEFGESLADAPPLERTRAGARA